MDRRDLAAGFRERLAGLLREDGGRAALIRDAGLDRSALAQFLSPANDRLPRAETLRRIAEARGVSVDWLLCIETAPAGRQELATSIEFASAGSPDVLTPLDRWKREVEGQTIRYVPSALPMMLLPEGFEPGPHDDVLLQVLDTRDPHLEVAIPMEALSALAARAGRWRDLAPAGAAALLEAMAEAAERLYPAVRLHLYDGQQIYAPPFTVFGRQRAVLFLGETYLVITAAEQIDAFARRFDAIARAAATDPRRAPEALAALAEAAAAGRAPPEAAP